MTAENYPSAVATLKERFGNSKKSSDDHVKKLFSVYPVNHPDARSLRTLYDFINIHIRSLDGLDIPRQSYEMPLVPHLVSKLPAVLKLAWARKDGENNLTAFFRFH